MTVTGILHPPRSTGEPAFRRTSGVRILLWKPG